MTVIKNKVKLILFLFTAAVIIASCGKSDDKSSGSDKELTGAGATFPYPLYSKMFDVYGKEHNVKVNFQSVGSGAGQQQMISKTVDFGATDAFMKDEQLSKAPAPIVHIPICLGAVVVTYNIEGNPTLKLTPQVLAEIFMGKIKKWDDEKIKSINPDANLPSYEISVVHRSDGSGTSAIFTDYLSKVSEDWKKDVGSATSVNWPAGLGAKGNEGVGGLVKQTPGSIGYVELIYALQNKMPTASLQNKKGNFIAPTLKSINASSNVTLSEDTRVSLTDSDADDAYPISGFTWILLYKDQKYNNRSEERAKQVVNLVWWMVHDGQQYAEPLEYATLSPEAVKKAENILKSITYGDMKILP